jgi:hypothetical protein
LVLPIIAYTLCTTKLEIRTKFFLLGIKGMGEVRKGVGGGWKNDPNIVCVYE